MSDGTHSIGFLMRVLDIMAIMESLPPNDPRAVATLDYSPASRSAKRRWPRLVVLIIALVCGAILLSKGVQKVREILDNWKFSRDLNRAIRHPTSPGLLAFSAGAPQRSVISPDWSILLRSLALTPNAYRGSPSATVFQGMRCSPDGIPYFLIINAHYVPRICETYLSCLIIRPGADARTTAILDEAPLDAAPPKYGDSVTARFYTATLDPADTSKLTIEEDLYDHHETFQVRVSNGALCIGCIRSAMRER